MKQTGRGLLRALPPYCFIQSAWIRPQKVYVTPSEARVVVG